jgi:beta-ureidopropionase
VIRIGLIQAHNDVDGNAPVEEHKKAAILKHERMIRDAAKQGAKIVCLQEIFYGPYFCTEQTTKWYAATERIPDGPTTNRMQDLAKELGIVLVVPMYEIEAPGFYYNTAAVIDADGTYMGKYRKHHIPQVQAGPAGCGFWEKYYFRPGNLGFPVFDTAFAKVGVYICYDRHFPEGARILGLNGAEIVFNPSATVAGLSEYLWKLEQPAHAVANGYYVGAINRVGFEPPWNMGEFYGQSYLVDPRGQMVAVGSRDKDEVVIGDMDRDVIRQVRDTWQFYRDRRPEAYDEMVAP